MSEMSASLDLTEFFNNDDSQGQGLAEFLQKRRGVGQRQNFLFVNCEMQRMSLEVELEKLPPSQQETSCKNNIENEKEHDKSEWVVNAAEKQMPIEQGQTDEALPLELNAENSFEVREDPGGSRLPFQPLSPISPERPQNPVPTVSPSQPYSLLKPVSPRQLLQRCAAIHKSGGGVSPSDRLRRYSLKQLSKHGGGRRTLLREFESTIDDANFEPPSCSTPLSQPQSNSPAKSSSINSSCCRNTEMLVKSLQRKDDELKKYMDSILENTLKQYQFQKTQNKCTTNGTDTYDQAIRTPVKRSTEFENEDISAQGILNPDKSVSNQRHSCSRLLRSKMHSLPSKIKNTQVQNCSPQRLCKSSTHLESTSNTESVITSKVSKTQQFGHHQQVTLCPNLKTGGFAVPNTSLQRNVTIQLPAQNVDTQLAKSNTIIIKSSNPEAVVVVPVNQTFNRSSLAEAVNNNTIEKAKTKQSDNNLSTLSTQLTHLTDKTNDLQCNQIAEDNLKLSDILTEDEEVTHKAAESGTTEYNSEMPLNLAKSATNLRTKRLHKRSLLRRRLQMDHLHLNDTETETDEPPQVHSSKRIAKKQQIPLNKEPGIPLNGEKFAQELSRMSNYEILDLRKRNSIGRVFVKSGRRTRYSQEEAVKKQRQLDEQIEKELLRRNMNELIEKQPTQSDEANVDDVEYFAKPDDSMAHQQEIREVFKESPLINEKSSDRVSFKAQKINRRLRKNKNHLPEILKQYLKVSKTLSRKKKKNYINKSKRSLYTQGDSQSEDTNSTTENIGEKKSRFKNKQNSIPYVSSPPKSDELITTLRDASPPPPLRVIRNCATEHQQIRNLRVASPPPPLSVTRNCATEHQQITTLRVASPSPPLSVTRSSRSATEQHPQITNEVELNLHDSSFNLDDNVDLPPPPPGFDNDSGVIPNKIFDPSPTTTKFQSENAVTNNTYLNTNHNADNSKDNHLFKKPQQPAPKKRGRKRKVNTAPLNDITTNPQQISTSSDVTTDCTLRRSKRGHVALKYPSILQLLQKSLENQLQSVGKKQKRGNSKVNEINSNINSTKSTEGGSKENKHPTVSEDVRVTNKEKPTKIKESKTNRNKTKNYKKLSRPNENLDCTRFLISTPPPVDHINIVFDQLRNTTSRQTTPPDITTLPPLKIKPLKVRVARLKSCTKPVDCDSVSTVSSTTSKNSNHELISWLKNITPSDSSTARNGGIFNLRRISSACSLSFTELQGIEYAFYDTDENRFLGYLRFKPRQKKPRKKTKLFCLHFVILVGDFRITIGDKDHQVSVGDMVAVEKLTFYDIENITDDIGILMFVKK